MKKPLSDEILNNMKPLSNWKMGEEVYSIISMHDLTKGKKYKIIRDAEFPDCFCVKNDVGEISDYMEDYFVR